MLFTIILTIIILSYAGYIAFKMIRDMSKGKCSSCSGCSGCSNKETCQIKTDMFKNID
jgi:hypothetical protein